MQGWKERLLSQGGREVLIKAVLQAMPTYSMACFKLPKSLCKDVESLIRKFWWGYKGEARKIHWLGWKKLCKPKCQGGLGFKDIENFNLAMLGKQVWRLLHKKDSLFYKVFKAKFFPNCSILEEGVNMRGSYAWQSILQARKVVRMGSKWRIGDGKSVLIRGDKWLPDIHSSRVVSPQKNLPNNSRVCALIDEENNRWIEDRVQEEFLPFEAAAITSIPLSTTPTEDRLIWAENQHGHYTTKSAYRILSREADVAAAGTSNPIAHKQFWVKLWSINVPNKIRHFLWRAATDSLPTKVNLQKRKIVHVPLCERCGDGAEDTVHALWGCQMIKHVWWELENCRNFLSERFVSFRDLLQGILAQNNQRLVELFAIIGWSIWGNRNATRVGTSSLPLEKIFKDAVERLQEFHSVQAEPLNHEPISHPTHWLPPPPTVYKLNFDGASFPDMASAGLGVVARDSDGMVIASLSERITQPPTVEALEALACRRAVIFASEIGLQDVVFEGDSEVIINHLNAGQPCFAAFGHIVDEVQSLSASFRNVSFSHTKRKGNNVADKLAKLARNLFEPKIWLEETHTDVMSAVILDRGFHPV